MKSCHITVVTLLGNGHVYPSLPLCSELVRRGHRVSFVTNSHYAEVISETGAEPVVFNGLPPDKNLLGDIKDRMLRLSCDDPEYWRFARLFQQGQFAFTDDMLQKIFPFFQRNMPELILYDAFTVGGRVLSRRLNRPAVRTSPYFAQYKRFLLRRKGRFVDPPAAREYRQDLDYYLDGHGITTKDNLWYNESLNIQFIPEAFQFERSHFDDRFCFVGALLDRPFRKTWKVGDIKRPIVLISDLSGLSDASVDSAHFYDSVACALAHSGLHCILSVGRGFDPNLLRPLPDNFEINRFASHLEILPHASLSICHGGLSSTLEAIYHGVPVLLIPQSPGCEEVADRAIELGLGECIHRNALSFDELRGVVERMISDSQLLHQVKLMQKMFHESGGATLAADRIEASMLKF